MSAVVDLDRDTLLTFPQAAARLPGRPNLATLHRWRLHGCRGIKLACVKVGGRRYVTARALDEFIAALSAGSSAPTPASISAARAREIAAASARCDAIGI
jgi:hypothetical protein